MRATATVHGDDAPGSTSSTISIASFQKGTIAFRPVRLKSSSMKSSATSQKYSCPGSEQNQLIHVSVDVGVDEPAERCQNAASLVCSIRQDAQVVRRQVKVEGRAAKERGTRTVPVLLLVRILHHLVPFLRPAESLLLLDIRLSRVDRRLLGSS